MKAQRQALLREDNQPERRPPFDVGGLLAQLFPPPAPEPEAPPTPTFKEPQAGWLNLVESLAPFRAAPPTPKLEEEWQPVGRETDNLGDWIGAALGGMNESQRRTSVQAKRADPELAALTEAATSAELGGMNILDNLLLVAGVVPEASGMKSLQVGAKAAKGAKAPKPAAQAVPPVKSPPAAARQAMLREPAAVEPGSPPVAPEGAAGGMPPVSAADEAMQRLQASVKSIGHQDAEGFVNKLVEGRYPGQTWDTLDPTQQWALTYEGEQAARDWAKVPTRPTVPEGPTLEAIETKEAKPPRKPLWAEAAGEGGQPPAEPPPIALGQPELPSGRKPGGIGNQVEVAPTDSWSKLDEALAEPKGPPLKQNLQDKWRAIMRQTYDKNNDLKFLERETGIPTHKWAQVAEGATGAAEDDLTRLVFPELDKVGNDMPYLEKYMVLKSAQDKAVRNPSASLPGGMSLGDAVKNEKVMAQKLGPERFAKVKAVADRLYELNTELVIRPEVEAGILSPKAANLIMQAHPHYLSFAREEFTEASKAIGGGAGRSRGPGTYAGSGMKEMTYFGYSGPLDQPLARWAARVIDTRRRISQNIAKTKIVEALQEVKNTTGQDVIRFEKEAFEPGIKVRRPFGNTNTEGLMTYRKAGEDVTVQIPKVFADIANKVDVESADALTRIFRAVGAPLRAGAVEYNPVFVPVNTIRDSISAMFREGLIPLSPDYIRGWIAAIAKNSDFSDAAQAGVLMSGIAEQFAKTSDLAMAKQLMGGIQVRNAKDALLLLPRFIKMANITSERATRIAVYKKLRNAGIDKLEAAVRSRDATVDFAKSGNLVALLNQMVPFLNAGVQGTVNTAKVFRYNPKQAVAIGAALSTPSIAFWLWNQRYETAKMIPDYEYRSNWVVMTGEGVQEKDPKNPKAPAKKFPIYVKIPKGPSGAILTAPAEMLLRAAWAKDDRSVAEHFLEAASTIAESAMPVELAPSGIMSPLVSTGMALQTGYDPFRKQTIVPKGEQGRIPEQQFGPETAKVAVALGQRFGVSPRLIEFAINDYTAGTGKLAMWMLDLGLGALGYNPQAPGEWKKRPLTTAEQAAVTPVASRFIGAKNTQADRLSWGKFDEVVKRQKQELAQIPELVRLGIDVSRVGDTVNGKQLTVDQQTAYQERSWKLMKPKLEALAKSPLFLKLSDDKKLERVRKVMGQARETARRGAASSSSAARPMPLYTPPSPSGMGSLYNFNQPSQSGDWLKSFLGQ